MPTYFGSTSRYFSSHVLTLQINLNSDQTHTINYGCADEERMDLNGKVADYRAAVLRILGKFEKIN